MDTQMTPPPAVPEPVFVLPALSRMSLAELRERNTLSATAWETAMDFCGFRPGAEEWRLYWRQLLLLGGALFLVAGVIFFIAWNWNSMHHFTRLALTGSLVAAFGLGAVWRGPDTDLGKALLLCCGISVGPLLAVFGQTYQTGSELWELFRVWTAVLFALSLAGRQAALWFTTWLSANVFVMLWLGRSLDSPLEALGMFSLLPECVFGLAFFLVVWEFAAYRSRREEKGERYAGLRSHWLLSRWLPRLLFLDLTVRLTSYLCLFIVAPYEVQHLTAFVLPYSVLFLFALVVAGVSLLWYREKTPDLFMFACLVSAGAILVVAFLLKAEFLFEAGVGAVFVWGMIIVGLTAGVAAILRSLQRAMEATGGIAPKPHPGASLVAFFAPARRAPEWAALREHLVSEDLLAEETPLPRQPEAQAPPASPWYVSAILAIGGWIAAVVLLAFLALFLFSSLGIHENEGAALLTASLLPLGVAYACLQRPGIFLRNFGFSLALTGSAGACIGLGYLLDFTKITPFCFALILTGLCFIMHSASYRFLAVFCAVQCIGVGVYFSGLDGMHFFSWRVLGEEQLAAYLRARYMPVAWWAVVALALALFRLREGLWRGEPYGKDLEPAFAGAYGGMLAALISSLACSVETLGISFFAPSSVGGGAALGFVFFVWALVKEAQKPFGAVLVLGCAVLALPLGLYVPGVVLAAFGLALSRYRESLVMQGATCAFLFVYMVYYYYILAVSLLYKSLFMAATGAVLLMLALCLDRYGSWEKRHA